MEATLPRRVARPLPAAARRPSRALRQLQIGVALWYGAMLLYGGLLTAMVHGLLASSVGGHVAIGLLPVGGAWLGGGFLQIDALLRISRRRR